MCYDVYMYPTCVHPVKLLVHAPMSPRPRRPPPAMPVRNLRIDNALWERLRRTAQREQRRALSDMARVAMSLGLDELDRRWALVHGE